MRRITSVTFILFVFGSASYAGDSQRDTVTLEWARKLSPFPSWSRDKPTDSVLDSDGNLYVTGMSEGEGSEFDYLTMKVSPGGEIEWSVRYDGAYHGVDIPNAITVDDAGNVYVTGMSILSDTSQFDVVTIKYNSVGDLDWLATYAGPGGETGSWWERNFNDCGSAIGVDPSGNVFVTGFQTDDSQHDFITIKYNSSGIEEWTAVYNGPANATDEATTLVVDRSGSVYVSGRSANAPAARGVENEFYDYITIKYDGDGTQLWVTHYNVSDRHFSTPSASALCEDGSLVVTGGSGSLFDALWEGDQYDHDILTVKYNAEGTLLWAEVFDNHLDYASDLAVDPAGNVFVTGTTGSHSPYSLAGDSLVTFKYSAQGVLEWVVYQGKGLSSAVQSAGVEIDQLGDLYVAATQGHFSGQPTFGQFVGDSITVMKYGADGSLEWIQYYSGEGETSAIARDISLSASGEACIVGDWGTEFDSDVIVLKYSSYSTREWVTTTSGSGVYVGTVTGAQVDDAGNTYLTGPGFVSGADIDFVTMKVNPTGGFEWTRTYSHPSDAFDIPKDIAVDKFGGVYVTGSNFRNGHNVGSVVIKYSASGNEEWTTLLEPEAVRTLSLDASGGLFVGGSGIIKLDVNGNLLWHQDGWGDVFQLEVGPNGDVYATTYGDSYGFTDSLRMLDTQGNLIWSADSPIEAIAFDDSGNIYTSARGAYGSGWTRKFDENGMIIWTALYGGAAIAINGSAVAVGGTEFLHNLTTDGEHSWTRGFGSDGYANLDVWIDKQGDFYSSGLSLDFGIDEFNLQTVKYDSAGNQRWAVMYGDPDVGRRSNTLGMDSLSNVFVVNEEWRYTHFGVAPVVLKYTPYGVVTSTGDEEHIPSEFALMQNFPNPFNPSTTIRFHLPSTLPVELKIFDILGREMATVLNLQLTAGNHEVKFDGSSFASGLYFYRLKAGEHLATRKFMILK